MVVIRATFPYNLFRGGGSGQDGRRRTEEGPNATRRSVGRWSERTTWAVEGLIEIAKDGKSEKARSRALRGDRHEHDVGFKNPASVRPVLPDMEPGQLFWKKVMLNSCYTRSDDPERLRWEMTLSFRHGPALARVGRFKAPPARCHRFDRMSHCFVRSRPGPKCITRFPPRLIDRPDSITRDPAELISKFPPSRGARFDRRLRESLDEEQTEMVKFMAKGSFGRRGPRGPFASVGRGGRRG